MRAILPGRPQSKRQAISTAHWDGLRLVAYISGNAAVISSGPHLILQTLYIDAADPLQAITIDESTGRIAVCDDHSVYIYDPTGRDEGLLRWQEVHEDTNEDVAITSLSWASPEELLLGGTRLRLWYIPDTATPKIIWDQPLPYATALAYSSPDGELVASCGACDRMVKIWRRLSYEVDSTRFDVSYLAHPTSVTNLHWRKPWHDEQNLDNLLYTFCADNRLRVWVHSDHHSTSIMQQVAEIDMCNIIQPRRLSVGSMSRRRYAFIIDSREFSTSTEKAVQSSSPNASDHALEHLIAIANRSPEICIVLDGLGHMSAWGLENAGTKNKHPTEVFNIAHIGDLNIHFTERPHSLSDYHQLCVFAGGLTEASLSVLVHSYDGSISWYDTQITHLFDTAPRHGRVQLLTSWAGHDDPVKGIIRSPDGKSLCSWTEDGDVIIWKAKIRQQTVSLLLRRSFSMNVNIVDAIFSDDDLRLLRDDCWQILPSGATHDLRKLAQPKSLSRLRGPDKLGVFYDGFIEVYNAKIGSFITSLQSPPDSDYTILVPAVDDRRSVQDLMAVGPNGLVTSMTRSTDNELLVTAVYPTAVSNPVRASAFGGKTALVGEKGSLTIWDSLHGVCEARVELNVHDDTVGSLDWYMTEHGSILLAVACTFKIIILAQQRYSDDDAWRTLLELRVREYTSHAIGCISFLADGGMVVGAGNQLFVPEMGINADQESAKLVTEMYPPVPQHRKKLPALPIAGVVHALNGMLAVYHPRVLHLLLATNQIDAAKKVLQSLHRHLKFFSEGDELSSMLDITAMDLSDDGQSSEPSTHHLTNGTRQNRNETPIVNRNDHLGDMEHQLKENLESQRIPFLTIDDQSSLAMSVNTAVRLERQQRSVDENALRYLHGLYSSGKEGVPWSSIVSASMSTSQEVLVDLVTQHYGGKLTWEAARRSGLFMWLSEPEAVRIQMENVGRAEYTKHEDRNPVDCSLYYLALDKKNVLQGLWRTSIGIKEKANTIKLLANNFSDPKWRATALKNAYALISRRRFEYAAAFFLLGGSLNDAVNVCVHQIKDLQLAVAIARVYHDDGVVLKRVVEQDFLPAAAHSLEGRWMACWAYQVMLNQPQKAIQALVRPLHEVLAVEVTKETLDFRINDPIMSSFYLQLRSPTPAAISPREEWTFVLRCATYLSRMGCYYLTLPLLRDWKFVSVPQEQTAVVLEDSEEESKRDMTLDGASKAEGQEEKKKPLPTQFVEPSADSLLDNFGF